VGDSKTMKIMSRRAAAKAVNMVRTADDSKIMRILNHLAVMNLKFPPKLNLTNALAAHKVRAAAIITNMATAYRMAKNDPQALKCPDGN